MEALCITLHDLYSDNEKEGTMPKIELIWMAILTPSVIRWVCGNRHTEGVGKQRAVFLKLM